MPPREAITTLLAKRAPGKSICPSEAARLVSAENWREEMDAVRGAAAEMASRGELVITQRGQVVDLGSVRGPIRLRLP